MAAELSVAEQHCIVSGLLLAWIYLWPKYHVKKTSLQMSMFDGMSEIRPGALDSQADMRSNTQR